jgi:hypothetical protein
MKEASSSVTVVNQDASAPVTKPTVRLIGLYALRLPSTLARLQHHRSLRAPLHEPVFTILQTDSARSQRHFQSHFSALEDKEGPPIWSNCVASSADD